MSYDPQKDPTVIARKLVDELWQKSDLRGRCWGLAKPRNRYRATNITIAIGPELVSISLGKNGQLRVHQFRRVKETTLGHRVKKSLQQGGSFVEKG